MVVSATHCGMLLAVDHRGSSFLPRRTVKLAFRAGSSMQGKAFLKAKLHVC